MLSTYDRLMQDTKVTRTRECTVDNRHPDVLLAEYRATIELLRWEVQRLRQATKDTFTRMEGM